MKKVSPSGFICVGTLLTLELALNVVVWYFADTAWVLLMVIIGYSYVDPVREVVMCFPQTRDASRLCVDKRSSSGGIAGR